MTSSPKTCAKRWNGGWHCHCTRVHASPEEDAAQLREERSPARASIPLKRIAPPQVFLRRFKAPVTMSKHVWFVAVAAFEAGTVSSLSGLSRIESLASFSGYVWKPGLGDALRPCVDQQTIPALVVLSHRDEAVVRADYEAIRALEADDVFGLKEKRR